MIIERNESSMTAQIEEITALAATEYRCSRDRIEVTMQYNDATASVSAFVRSPFVQTMRHDMMFGGDGATIEDALTQVRNALRAALGP